MTRLNIDELNRRLDRATTVRECLDVEAFASDRSASLEDRGYDGSRFREVAMRASERALEVPA